MISINKLHCQILYLRPKIKYCLFTLDLPTHKNCPYPKYFIGISFKKLFFIRNIELNAILHLSHVNKVLVVVNFRFIYISKIHYYLINKL